MNNDELIAKAIESARNERAPSIEVTDDVMRRVRQVSRTLPATFERQLRFDALIALALALLVLIPAQHAALTLLDPMVAFFAAMESAL